jgi:hypothetical protein
LWTMLPEHAAVIDTAAAMPMTAAAKRVLWRLAGLVFMVVSSVFVRWCVIR